MKFVFWVSAALFIAMLLLRVKNGQKRSKKWFTALAVVFFIPFAALLSLNLVYNLKYKPEPTVSTVLLQNDRFSLGAASKHQPTTLDEYMEITAPQIGQFHQQANAVWPDAAFDGSVAYFVTADKHRAWKVKHDGSYYELEDPTHMPLYSMVVGYSTEFYIMDEAVEGEKGLVIVISEDELLDQIAAQKYTHVGTYDAIITYIHEGFHAFTQSGEEWVADSSDHTGENYLDNVEARQLRTYALELLHQAILDEANRDLYTLQAIKVYQEYQVQFPGEYRTLRYQDKMEGTAMYFEVVSCLQVCYPETVNTENYLDAATLWVSNRRVQGSVGASKEAYELGAACGILLDLKSEDKTAWKHAIAQGGNQTPLELLATRYTQQEIDETPMPEMKPEFAASVREKAEKGIDTTGNFVSFLYHCFF